MPDALPVALFADQAGEDEPVRIARSALEGPGVRAKVVVDLQERCAGVGGDVLEGAVGKAAGLEGLLVCAHARHYTLYVPGAQRRIGHTSVTQASELYGSVLRSTGTCPRPDRWNIG